MVFECSGVRMKSDSKLQTPNSKLETPNPKPQTPNSKLETPNSQNSKLQTPNSNSQTPTKRQPPEEAAPLVKAFSMGYSRPKSRF
jgi:hypothetical protein